MKRGALIYEGKAKRVYDVEGQPQKVWMEFKNSLTAFNALKKGEFEQKGEINREIATLIFQHLEKNGVQSHFISSPEQNVIIGHKVEIIPLEVVVRNVVAGSLAKKFGMDEGQKIPEALVEFYYKNDALQDPFISDDQILLFKYATAAEIITLKKTALRVNQIMQKLFAGIGIELVDFKIEFGRDQLGNIILADEISPDSCRLWDLKTGEKLDKDRFRRDLGNVKESYVEVLTRLKNYLKGGQ